MNNIKYLINAFTAEELSSGCFFNWDGRCPILTRSFVNHMSNYIDFDDVKVILDIGSRDACQSLEFNRWFPNAKIYAFEPVPKNIEWCIENTKNIENITIIPKAINSFNGKSKFYQVVNGNVGASSFLLKSGHSRSNPWEQQEIEVDCVRLDDWLRENNIEKVDLMWVDVQGIEREVFKSMTDYLWNVDGIATEIELQELYKNATMKPELDELLGENFVLVEERPERRFTEADVVYVNKKYIE